MNELINCPDCKGHGGGTSGVGMEDCVECPTCEGTGEVGKGVKGWLQNLLESKV